MALGELGLKLNYFYSLTEREFNNIVLGYRKKEEENFKIKLVLNRRLEFAIIAPHLDKKHKSLTPEKYMPFAWENEQDLEDRKFFTAEEKAAIAKKLEQTNKKE